MPCPRNFIHPARPVERFAFADRVRRLVDVLKSAARKSEIIERSQAVSSCPVLAVKIFCFRFSENHDCIRASRVHQRDVSRSSRTWSAGCDGRVAAARRAARDADGEIAWSWRPDAGVKSRGMAMSALRARRAVIRAATEANKPGTPRRARISRKPLRRGCRSVFGCTC